MKSGLLILALLILALTSALSAAQPEQTAYVVVESGLIKIGAAGYEVGFSSANGSVAYILDRTSGQHVSEGDAALWTATFDNDQKTSSADAAFSYAADAATNQLMLTYTGDFAVTVTVSLSDSHSLKMQAAVSNHSGHAVQLFGFPGNLRVVTADVEDALLPMMPGALLHAAFFRKGMTYNEQYPGVMFADYLALRSGQGKIALYSETGRVIQPVYLGFASENANSTTLAHNFKTWVADGSVWSSPAVIVRVGQDYPDTIAAYRVDNGIEQYPSLRAKLGDTAPTYFASPMIKLDLAVVDRTFADLKESVIARLNFPGIIHFVVVQPGGHDNHYPDFIPPDPHWGTTGDFADLVGDIHGRGGLAVPYTNFSWWDNNGPALTTLPRRTTLPDVIVTDAHGLPDFESYGPRSGYVVDLNNAFVQDKIAQQHAALLHDVGLDGIFEDQWGIRDAPYDFNPAGSATYDPATAYFEGVRAHFRAHADSHLFTESGVDVLAQQGIGFMGTNYLWDMLGYRTTAAYTTYYPMAGMLLRDKVLLYQHDLAAQTWTKNKDMLRWNLAQGYGLSSAVFDETLPGVNLDNPWLNLIGVFQKYALANYADQLVQRYDDLGSGVTRTVFSTYRVYANGDGAKSYSIAGYTLPPGGVVTLANDGSVAAGVFTSFHDHPLTDGDHYLVEVRSLDEIRVYQPIGSDTTLHIPIPWAQAAAEAHRYDGSLIAPVDAIVSDGAVQFDWAGSMQGESVGYYRIAPL